MDKTTFTFVLNFCFFLFCLCQQYEPHSKQNLSLKKTVLFSVRPPPQQVSHWDVFAYFFVNFGYFIAWTREMFFSLIRVLSIFTFINLKQEGISLWHSSVTFCNVISGSCHIIVKILDLMSLSFTTVSPWTKITHLNMSIEMLPYLNNSH